MILPLREAVGRGPGVRGSESAANSSHCALLIRRTSGEYYGRVAKWFPRCCGVGGQVVVCLVLPGAGGVGWLVSFGCEGCCWWWIFT